MRGGSASDRDQNHGKGSVVRSRSCQGKRIKTRQRGGTRRAATSRAAFSGPSGRSETWAMRPSAERGHFHLHFRFDAFVLVVLPEAFLANDSTQLTTLPRHGAKHMGNTLMRIHRLVWFQSAHRTRWAFNSTVGPTNASPTGEQTRLQLLPQAIRESPTRDC